MSDPMDLTREHDLPPKWDGHQIEWGGWQSQLSIFICPPPKPEPCRACGRFGEDVVNHGTVTIEGIPRIGRGRLAPQRLHITAYRCPHCRFDHVVEPDGTSWDLDYTDYGDEGSWSA